MKINVIHGGRIERKESFLTQFEQQGIVDYEIWFGIHDKHSIVRTINLSHKQIVEYAQLRGDKMVCIAEDDILFTHPDSYKYFLDNIPQDFDIYLGGIYTGHIEPDNSVKSFTGFHLYIVHERFYETYLSTDKDTHIDISLANLGKYILCNPMAAIQLNGFSSNTGKEMNYDFLLANKQLYKG